MERRLNGGIDEATATAVQGAVGHMLRVLLDNLETKARTYKNKVGRRRPFLGLCMGPNVLEYFLLVTLRPAESRNMLQYTCCWTCLAPRCQGSGNHVINTEYSLKQSKAGHILAGKSAACLPAGAPLAVSIFRGLSKTRPVFLSVGNCGKSYSLF